MSQTQLTEIAIDLAAQARQRGWSDVARFADASRPDATTVAVVRFLDAEVGTLLDTLRAATPLIELTPDAAGAEAAWLSDRLVVAFSCGALPSSDVVQWLAAVPQFQTLAPLALVLTGADQITSAEDLALVEAMARKFLLPATAAGASDLATANAFLWSDAPLTDAALRERVANDKAALHRWLAASLPAATATQLRKGRLRRALAHAVQQNESLADNSSGADAARRFEAADDLATLRGRVLGRLRSDADVQSAAWRVAVDELEADLIEGLDSYLGRRQDRMRSEQAVQDVLAQYFKETVERWTQASAPRLSGQWDVSLREIEQLLRAADWSVANEGADPSTTYPDRIVERLTVASWQRGPSTLAVEKGVAVPDVSRIATVAGVVQSLGAGLIGCFAGAVAGFGPAGMMMGGGLATAASVGYQVHAARGANHAALLAYARLVIANNMPELRSRWLQSFENAAEALRRALVAEFDRVESSVGAMQPRPTSGGAAWIAELQKRLDAQE